MNKIEASVKEIQNLDSLYIVTFEWNAVDIKMVSLDLDHKLKKGDNVILGVNFTSVALAKNFSGELSYTNQIKAKVSEVDRGELLSIVMLSNAENILESLLLTESVDRLDVKAGDSVTMIIKANDIFMIEVLP